MIRSNTFETTDTLTFTGVQWRGDNGEEIITWARDCPLITNLQIPNVFSEDRDSSVRIFYSTRHTSHTLDVKPEEWIVYSPQSKWTGSFLYVLSDEEVRGNFHIGVEGDK